MDCFPSQATFCWRWPCLCWCRLWFISYYPSHQTSSQPPRRDLLASGLSDRWASGACWLLCPTYLLVVSPHLHLLRLLPAIHRLLPAIHRPFTKINSYLMALVLDKFGSFNWYGHAHHHFVSFDFRIWGSFDLDIGYVYGVPHLLLV